MPPIFVATVQVKRALFLRSISREGDKHREKGVGMCLSLAGSGTRRSASWRGNLLKLQPWQMCSVSLMLYPSDPIHILDRKKWRQYYIIPTLHENRIVKMAQLRGRVALGSFSNLAGAVNKISESVKNIEKNFDNALASTYNANDANNITGKPMDTKTDMKDQTDIMTKFLDEAEKADSQTSPSVKDVVERSADQVETTSFDINDMQTASNLQKSEHEQNIKDKVTTHEDDETESEPLGSQIPAPEMNESVEKGQSQLLTSSDETSEMLSDVVSQDDNENNAEVHIQKEHHRFRRIYMTMQILQLKWRR
ncbi:hypothetical protein Tco_0545209 [Tanacetum coccineum]